jgi:hypothetical protein
VFEVGKQYRDKRSGTYYFIGTLTDGRTAWERSTPEYTDPMLVMREADGSSKTDKTYSIIDPSAVTDAEIDAVWALIQQEREEPSEARKLARELRHCTVVVNKRADVILYLKMPNSTCSRILEALRKEKTS